MRGREAATGCICDTWWTRVAARCAQMRTWTEFRRITFTQLAPSRSCPSGCLYFLMYQMEMMILPLQKCKENVLEKFNSTQKSTQKSNFTQRSTQRSTQKLLYFCSQSEIFIIKADNMELWLKALFSSIEGEFQSKKTLDCPTGPIVTASSKQGCTL